MSLYAYLRLVRPLNGLIASTSVILGAFLAKGSINLTVAQAEARDALPVVIVAVAAFLLLSAGNALNDFCDVETDRINKPFRAIPSGQVKRRSALVFVVVLFAIGTGLGLFVNWIAFLVAFIVSALLVLYTIRLRRLLLVGNVVIGILTGLTFISGGIAVGTIGGAVIPAVFALLFTAGREIVKDIQDMKGDEAAGLLSLPIKWGQRKAIYLSFIFLALVILISPWPYFLDIYSLYYFLCVVIGVDLVLIYCMLILLASLREQSETRRAASTVASLMKFDILIGLGAIYLGGIGL
jgi:geranylgeranylglycerol-phosphate geranylgeranyltransferase